MNLLVFLLATGIAQATTTITFNEKECEGQTFKKLTETPKSNDPQVLACFVMKRMEVYRQKIMAATASRLQNVGIYRCLGDERSLNAFYGFKKTQGGIEENHSFNCYAGERGQGVIQELQFKMKIRFPEEDCISGQRTFEYFLDPENQTKDGIDIALSNLNGNCRTTAELLDPAQPWVVRELTPDERQAGNNKILGRPSLKPEKRHYIDPMADDSNRFAEPPTPPAEKEVILAPK